MDCLSATGGMLIIGIAIHLLKLGKVNLENLLPSLVIVSVLAYYFTKYKLKNKADAVIHPNDG